jgi:hypothetical protein
MQGPIARRAATLLAILTLAGCASTAQPGPRYPAGAPRGEVADIQVLRDGTTIRMTNTTARAFGPSVLWLNQRYSRPIEGFAVGQTLELELTDFVDEHGDRYRAGGFFAAEPPKRLYLAQLHTPAEGQGQRMVGLIVIRGDEP